MQVDGRIGSDNLKCEYRYGGCDIFHKLAGLRVCATQISDLYFIFHSKNFSNKPTNVYYSLRLPC